MLKQAGRSRIFSEGYQAVSDWRAGHEEFWHSQRFVP